LGPILLPGGEVFDKRGGKIGAVRVHDKIGGNRTRSVSEGFCAHLL
jgi:hypothetical protein